MAYAPHPWWCFCTGRLIRREDGWNQCVDKGTTHHSVQACQKAPAHQVHDARCQAKHDRKTPKMHWRHMPVQLTWCHRAKEKVVMPAHGQS
eukprot:1580150-Alexandrium_andersonii.AAC.1